MNTNGITLKRDLWWQFTTRAIEMKHRGSYLGFIWAVLNPLLMGALYVSVFGLIFNGRFRAVPDETGIDFAIAVFLGLVLYHIVSETISAAPTFVVSQPNLVKKVVFPLEMLPLSQLGAFWFHGLISIALCLAAQLAIGRGLGGGIFLLPLVLAPLLFLTIGIGWLLSAIGVFFRDIAQIVPLISQLLLWSSAVFFSPEWISRIPGAWTVLKWNPVLHSIDLARDVVIWRQEIDLAALGYTWAAGVTALGIGAAVFFRTKPGFAEAI